jgi:2-dehydropantoate 2-reductase
MLVDFEGGRPMEIEGIIGGVVKRGRQVGVDCPRYDNLFRRLFHVTFVTF